MTENLLKPASGAWVLFRAIYSFVTRCLKTSAVKHRKDKIATFSKIRGGPKVDFHKFKVKRGNHKHKPNRCMFHLLKMTARTAYSLGYRVQGGSTNQRRRLWRRVPQTTAISLSRISLHRIENNSQMKTWTSLIQQTHQLTAQRCGQRNTAARVRVRGEDQVFVVDWERRAVGSDLDHRNVRQTSRSRRNIQTYMWQSVFGTSCECISTLRSLHVHVFFQYKLSCLLDFNSTWHCSWTKSFTMQSRADKKRTQNVHSWCVKKK